MQKDRQVIYKLKCISVVSFIFMTVEIMGGIMANSIAILADAFHLLSDVLAYIISLQAVLMSHRKAPFFMTFGYEKIQPLGALINVSIIWFVTLELVIEATERIVNKSVVQDPLYMLLTSFFGLGCNLYIMRVLHSDVEHGGHQGCSHAHGLQHHKDHQHQHGHDHNHDHQHKHGHNCSHGHGHDDKSKKLALIKDKKKSSHGHGHHQEHNHDHGHTHNHDQHDHKHQHADGKCSGHDHDHKHEHEGRKHDHSEHTHQHSQNCSHSNKISQQNQPDSAREINSFQSQSKPSQKKQFKSLSMQSLSMQQQFNIQSHISYKPDNDQNLSDQNFNIALKQKKRKQLFNNINIQAAHIHIISDIILSIGVIISAFVIYFMADRQEWSYWQLADPLCTYLFSVMAIYSTVNIAKDSIIILLDGCDDKAMLKDIIKELDSMTDIQRYEELRVWSLNRAKFAAAVKIYLSKEKYGDINKRDQLRDKVTILFSTRGITHYVEIIEQTEKSIKQE